MSEELTYKFERRQDKFDRKLCWVNKDHNGRVIEFGSILRNEVMKSKEDEVIEVHPAFGRFG